MELLRINDRILDLAKVTGLERTQAGVTVYFGSFEGWKFSGEEAAAVWAFFLNRAPDGMSVPVMNDPATSAATAGRDAQWELAFAAWLGKREYAWTFGDVPTNPGDVGAALDTLAATASDVGRALLAEEQRNAAKAAKPGGN